MTPPIIAHILRVSLLITGLVRIVTLMLDAFRIVSVCDVQAETSLSAAYPLRAKRPVSDDLSPAGTLTPSFQQRPQT
jgi:hypothetical protein